MRTHTILLLIALFTITTAGQAMAQRGPRGGERLHDGERLRAGFPTVDAMADAIDADAEQRAVLAEARLALLESRGERRGPRGRGAGEGRSNPLHDFLVDVAPALDTQETIALVDLFADMPPQRGRGKGDENLRGQAKRSRAGQGPGQGRGQGRHGDEEKLFQQLDLTTQQTERIEALYGTTVGGLRALQRQADGEPTEAQVEAAARIRADHQAQLEEILTDAQNSELAKLRAERRAERSAEGATRREERQAKMVDDLTAILDLSDAQRAAVVEALDTAEQKAMLERGARMAEGGPMPHLFHEGEGRALRDETRAAIADVLEPDQRELFARLQALRMERGRSGGPEGQGRGRRG